MDKFMNYVFMVLIAGFFTAIVFYAAHVFFPLEENKCWDKYTNVIGDKNFNDPKVQAEENAKQLEVNKCNDAYYQLQKNQEMYKLILIGAINILVLLLVLFVLGLTTIGLGLFTGILFSSIIATASYFNSSSKIALAIVIIEFILCMILLNMELKNKDDKKEIKKKR